MLPSNGFLLNAGISPVTPPTLQAYQSNVPNWAMASLDLASVSRHPDRDSYDNRDPNPNGDADEHRNGNSNYYGDADQDGDAYPHGYPDLSTDRDADAHANGNRNGAVCDSNCHGDSDPTATLSHGDYADSQPRRRRRFRATRQRFGDMSQNPGPNATMGISTGSTSMTFPKTRPAFCSRYFRCRTDSKSSPQVSATAGIRFRW